MLTRMTEEDWATVLEVFRACRSRRGAKGRDDRNFLEALHYFTVHNITWRALPEADSATGIRVWKRFWRLSQTGVFEAFFEALLRTSETAHLVQMFDSTIVRAHVSAGAPGAKGGRMPGARPLARRLLDQNPPEDRSRRSSRSVFISPRVRPATAGISRRCSISAPTLRPARWWAIRAMMPKPIARRRVSVASARLSPSNPPPRRGRPSSPRRSTGRAPASSNHGKAQAL